MREKHLRDIRRRFIANSVADKAVMLLRVLWVFAKEELDMDLGNNPGAEIRRLHRVSQSHKPWPDWLVARFEAEAEPRPSAQLALALLSCTGQRVSDVAKMRWIDFDGEEISVQQQKTKTELWIPCHSTLLEALKRTEQKSEFILTGGFGRPYTHAHGLSKMISTALSRMGVKGYSAHGLRHRAGKLLALTRPNAGIWQDRPSPKWKKWQTKEPKANTRMANSLLFKNMPLPALSCPSPVTAPHASAVVPKGMMPEAAPQQGKIRYQGNQLYFSTYWLA
jgi:integrase